MQNNKNVGLRRTSWWSHTSLLSEIQGESTLDNKILAKKVTTHNNIKHSFFPGNEKSYTKQKNLSKLIINADSKLKLMWDTFIIIVTILIAFNIPYSLSFFSDPRKSTWHVLFTLFGIDLLLNFNLSYYYEGNFINRRQQIASHYIRTNFFIDLLSSFPFEYFYWGLLDFDENSPRFFNNTSEYIRLLLLLKILKLYKLPAVKYQIQIFYPNNIINSMLNILNYCLIAMIVAHWMCCIINSAYSYNLKIGDTFSNTMLFDNTTRYLRFLERVVQTMTSVGYGEYPLTDSFTRILLVMFMSITSGLLGIFVGAIQLTINKSSANTIYFRNIMKDFTVFMRRHNIPKPLKLRIAQYLRYLKFSYNENLIKEEDIIKILSVPLREQIFLYTRGYVLLKVSQFNDLSTGCLKSLGYKMVLNIYAPGDLIICQEEFTTDIYFIYSGVINIIHQVTETTYTSLSKGKYFGEISFFKSQGRTASAVSQNFSEIFSLSRFQFNQVVKSLPKDFEKIQTLVRNFSTYGLIYLGLKCFLCKGLGHVARDCSNSVWKIDMQKVAKLAQTKHPMSKKNDFNKEFKRKIPYCNYMNDFSKARVSGVEFNESVSFKDRKYLKKATNYNQTVQVVRRNNSRLISLINELNDEHGSANNTDESNESEKNFLEFTAQVERKSSQVFFDL